MVLYLPVCAFWTQRVYSCDFLLDLFLYHTNRNRLMLFPSVAPHRWAVSLDILLAGHQNQHGLMLLLRRWFGKPSFYNSITAQGSYEYYTAALSSRQMQNRRPPSRSPAGFSKPVWSPLAQIPQGHHWALYKRQRQLTWLRLGPGAAARRRPAVAR